MVGFSTESQSVPESLSQNISAAADYDGLKKAVHTNIAFGLVSGCILTAVGMILAPQILVLMGTPESVLPNSIVYSGYDFAGFGRICHV